MSKYAPTPENLKHSRLLTTALLTFLLMVGLLVAPIPASAKTITNSLGMKFVLIPAGSFMMGSTDADLAQMKRDFKAATGEAFKSDWDKYLKREQPAHRVRISKPFYMQTTEVTNDQFAAFVRATGYKTDAEKGGKGYAFKDGKWQWVQRADWRHPSGPGSGISGLGSHPVVQVSWNDAQAFIKWLSRKEGVKYSLPTEAQWEYASRGGRQGQLYSWGNDMPPRGQVGNFCDETSRAKYRWTYYIHGYNDGYAETAPVGNYQSNGFGLYDMIGNVWEWCQDWYGNYPAGSVTDPRGPGSGKYRVVRGGSWGRDPGSLRSATRGRFAPDFRGNDIGFRLSRIK